MPEHKYSTRVENTDMHSVQALAYGTLIHLNWTAKYAADHLLVGYTPRSWKRYDNEITIEAADNELSITSKMVHGEAFDMMKRTQKDVNDFLAAFEQVKQKASADDIENWKQDVAALQTATITAVEEEVKQAAEIDKVMNYSKGGLQITYGLIIINVAVFILTIVSGVDIFSPQAYELLKWGASFPPLDLNGDWWRAFTSMFLHFGIIHIAMNMYALYMAGMYLEPMLGKLRFLSAYICAGLLASIISILWRKDDLIVGAGASGAIFGMFGVLLALMIAGTIPKQIRQALLQSVLIFVGYNVFYGFKPGSGVDNAAHLGGLVSGMVIGFLYSLTFKNPSEKKTQSVVALVTLATVMILFSAFRNQSVPPVTVDYSNGNIQSQSDAAIRKKFDEFAELETKALKADNDQAMSNDEKLTYWKDVSTPAWKDAGQVIEEMETLVTENKQKEKVAMLQKYVGYRKELTAVMIKALSENTNEYNEEINKLVSKINELLKDESKE